jgi:hypothetical protein
MRGNEIEQVVNRKTMKNNEKKKMKILKKNKWIMINFMRNILKKRKKKSEFYFRILQVWI